MKRCMCIFIGGQISVHCWWFFRKLIQHRWCCSIVWTKCIPTVWENSTEREWSPWQCAITFIVNDHQCFFNVELNQLPLDMTWKNQDTSWVILKDMSEEMIIPNCLTIFWCLQGTWKFYVTKTLKHIPTKCESKSWIHVLKMHLKTRMSIRHVFKYVSRCALFPRHFKMS